MEGEEKGGGGEREGDSPSFIKKMNVFTGLILWIILEWDGRRGRRKREEKKKKGIFLLLQLPFEKHGPGSSGVGRRNKKRGGKEGQLYLLSPIVLQVVSCSRFASGL